MNEKPVIRKPEVIEEEIDDLHRYFNGIPGQLRKNGAYHSYEQREIELNKELVISRLHHSFDKVDVKPNVGNR